MMAGGDPIAAIGDLYRSCREELLRYFRRRHQESACVEDSLHETFARLIRSAGSLRRVRTLRGYLFGIARRVSAEAWRRRVRVANGASVDVLLGPASAGSGISTPDLAALRDVLLALSPAHREALNLRFTHGLDYAEIAKATGVPIGTVRSRLHYALRALRAAWETEPHRQPKENPS